MSRCDFQQTKHPNKKTKGLLQKRQQLLKGMQKAVGKYHNLGGKMMTKGQDEEERVGGELRRQRSAQIKLPMGSEDYR